MKRLLIFLLLVSVLGTLGVTKVFACGGWFESSCGTDVQKVQDNQARMQQAVPLPALNSSLERKNIKKRLESFSDENKVSYIYLVSYGRVMAFYTVKGKITSGSKRLTSGQLLADSCGSLIQPGQDTPCGQNPGAVIQAPELDGTYGDSAPYIYFWTTDGIYVQWNGEYMMADQPLKITTQPELVREVK